ncbi:hypothetical protein PMAYCL1PPCAC_29174, partial [Pristionchus mayeri]
VSMFARPGITIIRFRCASQIRRNSEASTTRESRRRNRSTFADTVLKGHSNALEEMEKEIVKREDMRREDLRKNENLLLNRLLPHLQSTVLSNSRFVPVGSSITELASSHSDLDVVLFPLEKESRDQFLKTIHNNEGLKYEFMSVLRSTIVHSIHKWGDDNFKMENCLILPTLKVPLIICQFSNGSSLDISIPDPAFQSIRNTHLMRQYIKCDERVGRFMLWLKTWSSALEIRDSKTGLLSSYHLLLLAIHFLHSEQSLSVPVLPILYQTHNDVFHKENPIERIVSLLEERPVSDWTPMNKMSTAELIIRFFEYYSEMNVLQTMIFIDRGMVRSRPSALEKEAAVIFDPYHTQPACRSVNALRAFREAVLFTQSRMRNGFMFNPFPPSSDCSFNNFIESSRHSDWRVDALKNRAKINAAGIHDAINSDDKMAMAKKC